MPPSGGPPEAPRATRRLPILAGAAGLLVIAVVVWYSLGRSSRAGGTTPVLAGKPGATRIAVAAFEGHAGGGDLEWLRRGLPDMLVSSLVQYDHAVVLGREQFDILLSRAGVTPGEPIQLDRALAVAKRANAQLLVTGSFTSTGTNVRVDARVTDATTGDLVGADSIVATERAGILPEMDVLAVRIARRVGLATGGTRSRRNIVDVRTENLEAYRWYVQGLDRTRGLQPVEAIAAFQKAIDADPQFAMAHGRIGYAYALVHWEPERARPYLERAFQLSGRLSDKERAMIAAWYSVAHREYGEAIAAYRGIVERYPDDLEPYWRLGVLLEGEERFEEAAAVLEKGRDLDSEYPELYNSLGSVYVKLRRPREAIAMYRRYVELAPGVANAHDSLGLGYEAAGDYPNAVASFTRALEISPEFEIALIHLGNVHFLAGRYREAIAVYDRYIATADYDSDRSRGYACKAWVEFRHGNRSAAWRDAQRAVALSPLQTEPIRIALKYHKPHARDWLARRAAAASGHSRGTRASLRGVHAIDGDVALAQGNTEQAIAHYARAAALAPIVYHIEWFEDVLADGYAAAGKYELAMREYERVLRLQPHLARTRFGFARALERAGHPGRAREEYGRFLELWRDADQDIPAIAIARERVNALVAR